MALHYKANILDRLKEKGYSTARLRAERVFGESTIQAFRKQDEIPYKAIDKLCELLGCDVGDVIEYTPADERTEG